MFAIIVAGMVIITILLCVVHNKRTQIEWQVETEALTENNALVWEVDPIQETTNAAPSPATEGQETAEPQTNAMKERDMPETQMSTVKEDQISTDPQSAGETLTVSCDQDDFHIVGLPDDVQTMIGSYEDVRVAVFQKACALGYADFNTATYVNHAINPYGNRDVSETVYIALQLNDPNSLYAVDRYVDVLIDFDTKQLLDVVLDLSNGEFYLESQRP